MSSAHLSAHMALWQGGSKEKSLTNSLFVSEPVRLQAKDGTRTRDIHLGKVELYH